jgi:hypothetical protein
VREAAVVVEEREGESGWAGTHAERGRVRDLRPRKRGGKSQPGQTRPRRKGSAHIITRRRDREPPVGHSSLLSLATANRTVGQEWVFRIIPVQYRHIASCCGQQSLLWVGCVSGQTAAHVGRPFCMVQSFQQWQDQRGTDTGPHKAKEPHNALAAHGAVLSRTIPAPYILNRTRTLHINRLDSPLMDRPKAS